MSVGLPRKRFHLRLDVSLESITVGGGLGKDDRWG